MLPDDRAPGRIGLGGEGILPKHITRQSRFRGGGTHLQGPNSRSDDSKLCKTTRQTLTLMRRNPELVAQVPHPPEKKDALAASAPSVPTPI
jgi:hypothetical protein